MQSRLSSSKSKDILLLVNVSPAILNWSSIPALVVWIKWICGAIFDKRGNPSIFDFLHARTFEE